MSNDFTPVSERQRLQQLGYQKPHLLVFLMDSYFLFGQVFLNFENFKLQGDDFTRLDFSRRPLQRDVGKQMLYRDAHMTGWTYKEITLDDLKFPMVYGEGKRSRLLATIGVTRYQYLNSQLVKEGIHFILLYIGASETTTFAPTQTVDQFTSSRFCHLNQRF